MRRGSRRPARRTVVAALASLLAALGTMDAPAARADDRLAVPPNPTWRAECGACHLPYPPRLLPARSWRAVMDGLGRHFGTDASLDPRAAAEVAAFLERHAGRDRGGPTRLRITDTPWFRREHREIALSVWTGPAVKSPANCAACHAGAERGDYDDDGVRMPAP
jgi:hypothetical protein